jgi:glycosyltransferase involved in cell wall biosynthesis
MISTDRKIFEKNSAVRARIVLYGTLVEHLDIVVLSKNKIKQDILSSAVTAYSTCSGNRLSALFRAIRIGQHFSGVNLVTAQDPFETGFIGWRIARTLSAPLELQVHTDFMSPYFATENIKNRIRVMLARFLLPRADCTRVVSERIKKSIAHFVKTPISILPIFTDIKKFQNAPIAIDLHKKYPQFEKIILMVSRLEKEKNISLALNTFAEVLKKYPKTGLIIVGDGSKKQKLMFHASRLILQKNVVFEGWQNNLVSYYKTADIFLQTSNYEGYGLSLMEAYAAGLPIVATNVGIVGDIVSGEGISMCKIDDEECLTSALSSAILNSPRLIRALALTSKEEYLVAYKKQWELCARK